MVMAQYPNTQYVAHEFVRQYYTMLHKDPTQLHRFYTKESRLTHGGSPNAKSEEQPVCGQEAIFEKIAQLNFRNCCAKIRSVDSHPTIGGGVVIQVNGELANAGLTYRKFMQTFVLAQQEPKKYHVYNDIFRYQDETFEDTENDETIDGTVESENGYQTYEPMSVGQIDDSTDQQEVPSSKPLVNDASNDYSYSNYIQEKEPEQMNGDILNSEPEVEEQPEQADTEVPVKEPVTESAPEQDVPEETVAISEEPETKDVEEDDGTDFKDYENTAGEESGETNDTQASVESEGPPKPFTWAALAKKNTPTPVITPSSQTKPAPKKPSPLTQRTAPKKREEPAPAVAPQPKKETNEEPRRRNAAPDNHQIFIGNLPSNITEKDVRDAFGEFGNIVEVRLNPKNFGFIAFDGPDAPTKILNKTKVITIHNNTINTEVKRSVGGSGRGDRGGDRGGGGFRRGGSDKERRGGGERSGDGGGRSDFNKNSKNGGQYNNNRSGKNSFGGQKQQRSSDEGKNDSKGQKDQQKPREHSKQARR